MRYDMFTTFSQQFYNMGQNNNLTVRYKFELITTNYL